MKDRDFEGQIKIEWTEKISAYLQTLNGDEIFQAKELIFNVFGIQETDQKMWMLLGTGKVLRSFGWVKGHYKRVNGEWKKGFCKEAPKRPKAKLKLFPEEDFDQSLREGFAMAALTGLCAKLGRDEPTTDIVEYALEIADTMVGYIRIR